MCPQLIEKVFTLVGIDFDHFQISASLVDTQLTSGQRLTRTWYVFAKRVPRGRCVPGARQVHTRNEYRVASLLKEEYLVGEFVHIAQNSLHRRTLL
jgi:hypothetical protein